MDSGAGEGHLHSLYPNTCSLQESCLEAFLYRPLPLVPVKSLFSY